MWVSLRHNRKSDPWSLYCHDERKTNFHKKWIYLVWNCFLLYHNKPLPLFRFSLFYLLHTHWYLCFLILSNYNRPNACLRLAGPFHRNCFLCNWSCMLTKRRWMYSRFSPETFSFQSWWMNSKKNTETCLRMTKTAALFWSMCLRSSTISSRWRDNERRYSRRYHFVLIEF